MIVIRYILKVLYWMLFVVTVIPTVICLLMAGKIGLLD